MIFIGTVVLMTAYMWAAWYVQPPHISTFENWIVFIVAGLFWGAVFGAVLEFTLGDMIRKRQKALAMKRKAEEEKKKEEKKRAEAKKKMEKMKPAELK